MTKFLKVLGHIDTVQGRCPACEAETILIAIVSDFYRCTSCGEDTKQYVNGSIKYLPLTAGEQEWLKNQSSE